MVPPQARATAVVRQVMSEVVKPVQAQMIHEERVDVEAIDLYFRPVYAFEYEWAAKNKRVVVEYDALTGEIRAGGKRLGDQIRGMLDPRPAVRRHRRRRGHARARRRHRGQAGEGRRGPQVDAGRRPARAARLGHRRRRSAVPRSDPGW